MLTNATILSLAFALLLACGNPSTSPEPQQSLPDPSDVTVAQIMLLVADSVYAQQSFSTGVLLGESVIWDTYYANVNMDYEHWLAVGRVANATTELQIVFDSRYGSTCLRQTKPKSTDWTYVEHVGWADSDNPAVFTPMLPTLTLRSDPQPQWRVIDLTDSLITLSHDRYPNGLVHILQVDRQNYLIVSELSAMDSTVVSFVEYSAYGENPVFKVHQNQQDCESRN